MLEALASTPIPEGARVCGLRTELEALRMPINPAFMFGGRPFQLAGATATTRVSTA
ncbi:MAG: hypothetical protein ACLU0O_02335 [Collinsella sp.]